MFIEVNINTRKIYLHISLERDSTGVSDLLKEKYTELPAPEEKKGVKNIYAEQEIMYMWMNQG